MSIPTAGQSIDSAALWRPVLARFSALPGAERKLRRLATASSHEQVADYLAEITYAMVDNHTGFQTEVEPEGDAGVDLRIGRDSLSLYVEITRFRPVNPGPAPIRSSETDPVLEVYGNPERDVRKAFQKIRDKFRQVKPHSAVIAVWNDDPDLEELEVEGAIRDLREDDAEGRLTLPPGLVAAVYGSAWRRMPDGKQFYCFPLHDPARPEAASLCSRLEGASVRAALSA
jgi:hypothetical protein